MKVRGFLYRAREAKLGATDGWIDGVKPTEEMIAAAKEAADAWAAIYEYLKKESLIK